MRCCPSACGGTFGNVLIRLGLVSERVSGDEVGGGEGESLAVGLEAVIALAHVDILVGGVNAATLV